MNNHPNFLNLEVPRKDLSVVFEDFWKKKEFIDVQLKIKDKLFDAHRAVLAAYSPALRAVLSDQQRISTTKICPISDEYVDVEIVEDLLNFIYTGKIKLTPDNVQPVCKAVHYLQINDLLEPSVNYLCQLITIENVLKLFKFSTACELEKLNYSCLQFVNNNHENVFESTQILELSIKHFKDLMVGLKKFWPKMFREETFLCIVRWTEKNLSERLNELPVLLKNIPLEKLPLKFITETVSTHPLVKDNIPCMEIVSEALAKYQTNTRQNMIVIGGTKRNTNDHLQSMSCYDPRTFGWSELPEMPSYRSHFGVTVADQQDIIVCGGYVDREEQEATASVMMFEWATKTWIDLPSIPAASPLVSIAMCKDNLYAIGVRSNGTRSLFFGMEQGLYSSSVLQYSFESKYWALVASMNRVRFGGRLVEYKDHLYVFGGGENTVERYDPTRNEWTIVANINDIHDLQATVHQDKFYLSGLNDFVVFDPETNLWSVLQAPPFNSGSSLVSLNDKLLAVGGNHIFVYGKHLERTSKLIYEFELSTQEWIEFDVLKDELAYHSTVVGQFF